MILSLVLSKIKFRSRVISAALPTCPSHLSAAEAGLLDLARADWHRLMRVNFTWILIILDDLTNERPHGVCRGTVLPCSTYAFGQCQSPPSWHIMFSWVRYFAVSCVVVRRCREGGVKKLG